ncbi:MAG: hypothetical protein HOP23_12320 [Methylococcaceae bacterium]|nr:hypothetical protein [Methylococcaceae bacterium]
MCRVTSKVKVACSAELTDAPPFFSATFDDKGLYSKNNKEVCACPSVAVSTVVGDYSVLFETYDFHGVFEQTSIDRYLGGARVTAIITGTPFLLEDEDLALTLVADPPQAVEILKPLTYTITVTNNGTTAAKNVIMHDMFSVPNGAILQLPLVVSATYGSCIDEYHPTSRKVGCYLGTGAGATEFAGHYADDASLILTLLP